MRILVAVIFAVTVLGCSKKASEGPGATPPSTNQVTSPVTNRVVVLDEAKAIEIARQTVVASNEVWASNIGFCRATRTDTGWRVLVAGGRVGEHCSITIDENGKVTGYAGGM
jgi:hypothetical protein